MSGTKTTDKDTPAEETAGVGPNPLAQLEATPWLPRDTTATTRTARTEAAKARCGDRDAEEG